MEGNQFTLATSQAFAFIAAAALLSGLQSFSERDKLYDDHTLLPDITDRVIYSPL